MLCWLLWSHLFVTKHGAGGVPLGRHKRVFDFGILDILYHLHYAELPGLGRRLDAFAKRTNL